jgi:Transcriptional regulator
MVAISLDLLEILDAIDRRGSFATAAEELNRVPSALSYTVQKYEDALGFSIFVRQGRRSVFTPSGRLLLEQGRELLKGAAALADGARTLASGWEPRLDIAVDSLLSFDTLMPVLAHFLNDPPLRGNRYSGGSPGRYLGGLDRGSGAASDRCSRTKAQNIGHSGRGLGGSGESLCGKPRSCSGPVRQTADTTGGR